MALELITSGWLTAPSYFIGGVALPLVGNDSIVKKRFRLFVICLE